MTSRRDLQLQQLGITQWILRRPTALLGKVTAPIPIHIRLVMVADKLPSLNEILISDVLRSLNISADQVLQITPDRISILPPSSCCNSWWLGVKEVFSLEGGRLVSSTLEELQKNPSAKVVLWRQICKYRRYFFTQDN